MVKDSTAFFILSFAGNLVIRDEFMPAHFDWDSGFTLKSLGFLLQSINAKVDYG
jgi:hypothetical protein